MRRNLRSATNNIFHTTAVALATFLNRFARVGAQPQRRERRLDHVGRSQVPPAPWRRRRGGGVYSLAFDAIRAVDKVLTEAGDIRGRVKNATCKGRWHSRGRTL